MDFQNSAWLKLFWFSYWNPSYFKIKIRWQACLQFRYNVNTNFILTISHSYQISRVLLTSRCYKLVERDKNLTKRMPKQVDTWWTWEITQPQLCNCSTLLENQVSLTMSFNNCAHTSDLYWYKSFKVWTIQVCSLCISVVKNNSMLFKYHPQVRLTMRAARRYNQIKESGKSVMLIPTLLSLDIMLISILDLRGPKVVGIVKKVKTPQKSSKSQQLKRCKVSVCPTGIFTHTSCCRTGLLSV